MGKIYCCLYCILMCRYLMILGFVGLCVHVITWGFHVVPGCCYDCFLGTLLLVFNAVDMMFVQCDSRWLNFVFFVRIFSWFDSEVNWLLWRWLSGDKWLVNPDYRLYCFMFQIVMLFRYVFVVSRFMWQWSLSFYNLFQYYCK